MKRKTADQRRAETCQLPACFTTARCSRVALAMSPPKLTKLELRVMEILWTRGPSSIRDIQEALSERDVGLHQPAYTTVQTIVYRLEWKKALQRTKKISNAHVFEAAISRGSMEHRLIDELLGFFGGRALPIVSHLIESGKLTVDEIREAQKVHRDHVAKGEEI
jgi:BlaI family penicillinase repressor